MYTPDAKVGEEINVDLIMAYPHNYEYNNLTGKHLGKYLGHIDKGAVFDSNDIKGHNIIIRKGMVVKSGPENKLGGTIKKRRNRKGKSRRR